MFWSNMNNASLFKNGPVWRTECDILVSKLLGFETFWFFFNDIGIGFGKFWYRKKYRYRFQKFMVSKKVSVSKNLVSKKYQILKILLKKQEILSKISRGGDACFCRWPEILSKISRGCDACFCQSGNPLKNIKRWQCLLEKKERQFRSWWWWLG